MPQTISHAAIIAGGASRRMGFPKALLPFEGEVLIARIAGILRPLFDEVLIVTNDEEVARAANCAAVPDIFPGKGPLAGIHAALEYFKAPAFCVACDLPFLRADVIADLCKEFENCDVLAPRVAGRMEPLHAVYAPSCLPVMSAALQNPRVGNVERVLAPLRLLFVDEAALRRFDKDLKFLTNVNTPQEWRAVGDATR
jgi:molybdopterin-guanine dinucleotide biosynthesis protein A